MAQCDLSCALDGICEPLCASPWNLCSVDEDCVLGFAEERNLQTIQRQFQRGFTICCWTTIIMAVLCGIVCFVMCLRVDNTGAPKINWERLDWASNSLRSIRIRRPKSGRQSKSTQGDIEQDTASTVYSNRESQKTNTDSVGKDSPSPSDKVDVNSSPLTDQQSKYTEGNKELENEVSIINLSL